MQLRGLDPLFLFVLGYPLPTRLSKHSMLGVVIGILGAVANRCLSLDSSLRASFRFFPPCFLRRIVSLLLLDFSFSLSLPLVRPLPVKSTSVGTILTYLDSSPPCFLGFIPPNVSRIVLSRSLPFGRSNSTLFGMILTLTLLWLFHHSHI